MGSFTFDVAGEDGSPANANGSVNGGKPGTTGGETGASSDDSGNAGGNNGTPRETSFAADTPKRRGRKPYPRDAAGNIIRPSTGAGTNAGGKEGLDLKNDRVKVAANIQGLHAIAAVLTRQPILNLRPEEASGLSVALCDVADYHGINLITAGGAFGLYAALATSAYMVYVPRIMTIKAQRLEAANNGDEPPTPHEARTKATNGGFRMDFSNDVVN